MSQVTMIVILFLVLSGLVIASVIMSARDTGKLEERLNTLEGEAEWHRKGEIAGKKQAYANLRVPEVKVVPIKPLLKAVPLVNKVVLDEDEYQSKHRSDQKNDYKDRSPRTSKHKKEADTS